MKREILQTPVVAALVAGLGFSALPAVAGADQAMLTGTILNAAQQTEQASGHNPLRRRWAQMTDAERKTFMQRRRAQAADNGHTLRERLRHLSPRQKAHLRQRLANMHQRPPHRPLPPQARRRAQAAGR